jgi:hypothetical protein
MQEWNMLFRITRNVKGKTAERPNVKYFVKHELITNTWQCIENEINFNTS